MNIKVNLDNLTPEEQEQLNALVKKANKPNSRTWKPKDGEEYYVFAIEKSYVWRDDDIDMFNYAIGDCFQTKEEAEFALERLKVIAEMSRYLAKHDAIELDWSNDNQEKWYIRYYHDTNDIEADYNVCTQIVDNSLYASSSEILENMIEEVGESRIKKYYFGVEENE